MLVMLMGCGAKSFDKSDAQRYFDNCYGKKLNFKIVSSEEATLPSEQPYTDDKGETHTHSVQKDYQTFTAVDKNGITCTLRNQFRYGCSGSVNDLTDDYAVQWLMAHPEIYEPLTNSGFECEWDGNNIILHVSKFADVKPAVKLAYSVVSNEKAALPQSRKVNMGSSDNEITVNRIHPCIRLEAPNSRSVISLTFTSKPQDMNKDTDILAYVAEGYYINRVKGSEYEKDLPPDALNRGEEIKLDIYSGSEKLDAFLQADYSGGLRISDSVTDGERVRFQNTTEICKAAGYEVEYSKDKNNNEQIIYSRNGYNVKLKYVNIDDKRKVNVFINGKNSRFSQESSYFSLSAEDFSDLFKIEFDYDFEKGTATIIE